MVTRLAAWVVVMLALTIRTAAQVSVTVTLRDGEATRQDFRVGG